MSAALQPVFEEATAPLRVALTGNPNCGETSLFNALTGGRQHVGNYPGVTVERRVGSLVADGRRVELVDLPGTYAFNSWSPEERIAQDAIVAGGHDVVVVVVDSTSLQRSLVLLVQVMLSGANPVLCLNMSDEAVAAGQRLDVDQVRALLGFPVVETVGHLGLGAEALTAAVAAAAASPVQRHRLMLGERLDRALTSIVAALGDSGNAWLATRLLVGDERLTAQVRTGSVAGPRAVEVAREQARLIEGAVGYDVGLFVTERHFGFVDGLLREVVTRPSRRDAWATSRTIDSVLVHRFLGLPIFAAAMYAIFWTTFSLGEIPMGWIESGFEVLAGAVGGLWAADAESPLRSLLVTGSSARRWSGRSPPRRCSSPRWASSTPWARWTRSPRACGRCSRATTHPSSGSA